MKIHTGRKEGYCWSARAGDKKQIY